MKLAGIRGTGALLRTTERRPRRSGSSVIQLELSRWRAFFQELSVLLEGKRLEIQINRFEVSQSEN